jgi:pyrroloquinoline quinone biosynthesis protein D
MTESNLISLPSHPTLSPAVRFRIDPISGDPVLLYPEGLLVLSATAVDIVGRCDGKNSVAQILAQMGEEYEVDEATLKGDVLECLADLSKKTLLIFLP